MSKTALDPGRVLTDDPEDPHDSSWLADNCEDCRGQLKDMTVRMLD